MTTPDENAETTESPRARVAWGSCALFACSDPYRVGATALALRRWFPRVETAGNGRDLLELALELRPDLVMVDRLLPCSDMVETIEQLLVDLPDTLVLVLTERQSFDECLRFFRAGACGYLSLLEEPEALVEQATRLLRAHQGRRTRRGRSRGPHHPGVWAFCGASDGDGRSSLLLNAAYELSRHGEQVAVVDLDLLFGDLAFFLKVPRVHPDLSTLLEEELFLEPRVIRQHARVHSSGIHLFPAPFSTSAAAAVDSTRIYQLIEALPRHYDHVLVDLPCGLPDELIPVLEAADLVLLVAGANLMSLKDLLVLERLLEARGVPLDPVRGLLTRVQKEDPEIERIVEKHPWIEFFLPEREKSMDQAIEEGVPYAAKEPSDPYSLAVRRWVTQELPVSLARGPSRREAGP